MSLRRRPSVTLCVLVAVLSGCGPGERSEAQPSGDDPRSPIFVIEPGATGPLTLEELNIDYDALSFPPSPAERKCIDARIEFRLAEIGDPATFDPEPTELFASQASLENWQTFDRRMKRILIVQAVVHGSLNECT